MGQDAEPRWYYVGNGQLRYKDINGWTDQYEDIDGHPMASDLEPTESPDLRAPAPGAENRVKEPREPSSSNRLRSSWGQRSTARLVHAATGLRALVARGRAVAEGRASEPRDDSPPNQFAELSPEWKVVLGVAASDPGPSSPATFTTHGTLTLTSRRGGTEDWRRSGTDDHDDLIAGARVTITDVSGEMLGLGRLEAGDYTPGEGDRGLGRTVFTFTVDDIPDDEDTYAVVVGGHTSKFTHAEMQAGPSLHIAQPDSKTPIDSSEPA